MLAGVIVLAFTGLGAVLVLKSALSGWPLMLHAAAAPAFAIGLALVALTWAGRPQSSAARLWFWLILASGLVVVLSGVLPMTPLFGTCGQHALVTTHLCSALVAVAAVALHAVSLKPERKSGAN
jgi:hypothetical protein